mgnify:CR=1 FL=1
MKKITRKVLSVNFAEVLGYSLSLSLMKNYPVLRVIDVNLLLFHGLYNTNMSCKHYRLYLSCNGRYACEDCREFVPESKKCEEKFCKKCWDNGKGCASCDEKTCPSNQSFCECHKAIGINPRAHTVCEHEGYKNTNGKCMDCAEKVQKICTKCGSSKGYPWCEENEIRVCHCEPKGHRHLPEKGRTYMSSCCHDNYGFCVSVGSKESTWHYECSECHKACDIWNPSEKPYSREEVDEKIRDAKISIKKTMWEEEKEFRLELLEMLEDSSDSRGARIVSNFRIESLRKKYL